MAHKLLALQLQIYMHNISVFLSLHLIQATAQTQYSFRSAGLYYYISAHGISGKLTLRDDLQ